MATNISPLAHVDPSAKIGDNVTIHPFAFIDADVEIGDGTEIMSYTSIIRGTRIGRDNKIYQGSIIGADPQDFRWTGCKTYCYVGDKNVIREHVIINRGITSEGGTRIGSESFIMAETHIGHDTVVADHCVLGNGVTIAGDASVGTCSILSSGVILHEKSTLGAWTLIKGGCRISGNVPPFVIMAHNPASYFGVNAVVLRKGGFHRRGSRRHSQGLPPYLSDRHVGVQCPQAHRSRPQALACARSHHRLYPWMQPQDRGYPARSRISSGCSRIV